MWLPSTRRTKDRPTFHPKVLHCCEAESIHKAPKSHPKTSGCWQRLQNWETEKETQVVWQQNLIHIHRTMASGRQNYGKSCPVAQAYKG